MIRHAEIILWADWYMGIHSERLLICFLLDILKSLVGLDSSAWELIDVGKGY